MLRRSCIVIVETTASSGQDLGLLVDAVHEVISLPAAVIMPPPPFGNPIRPDFIAGMAMQDGRHGEVIRVRNPESGKQFKARITGPNEAINL